MQKNIFSILILATLLSSSLLAAPKNKANKGNASALKIDSIKTETIKNDGLTILYGNAMIERLQSEGSFETYMQLANVDTNIQYRSCAYVGDQVNFRIRASRFGLHLKYLLENWGANRVIMAFGSNEAYNGVKGLPEFEQNLQSYIDVIKKRHNEAEYILVSPIAAEKNSDIIGINIAERNNLLKQYSEVMNKVATANSIEFVDLYTPTLTLFSATDGVYTINSQNLSKQGCAATGKILAEALEGKSKIASISTHSKAFQSIQSMVQRKAIEVAQAYHPANGISYYGLRSRAYEYNYEIPHHIKLANILDQSIWKQAANPSATIASPKLPIYKLTKLPNSKPKNGLGIVKNAENDLKDFTLADGFSINCFASSEDHPELINPLQMQFDSQGRLWVTCFSSYPHPVPGTVSNDTILIFEDTDRDGKADKKTIFANQLDLPDGLVFHKNGVIVSTAKKLIYLEDTDGDSKADFREEVLRGFDNTDTHHSGYLQRSPHGGIILSEALFHRGQFETLNGVFHTKDSTIMSFDMDTRNLNVERQMEAPNPWKVTYNKWGESIQFFGGGQIVDAETHNVLTPMGSAAPLSLGAPFRYDKGVSATFVDSPNFPKSWQNGLLTTHLLTTNEINYTPIKLEKGAYRASGKKTTIVKSNNKIFRPTDITFGHDGALYISDFYYPIIGHAQHSLRHKNRDYANGRIWRVTYNKGGVSKVNDLTLNSTKELFNLLKNPFLSLRQAVRNELSKRTASEVNNLINQYATDLQEDNIFSLELLWLMERQKNFSDTSLIKRLLSSPDVQIRRAATRSLRWWSNALEPELPAILTKLATDSDARVKMGVVTVISHLQAQNPKLSQIGDLIQALKDSPLAIMKSMLSWQDRPGIAPEFPVLETAKAAYIADSQWRKSNDDKQGVLYFESNVAGNYIIGHADNAFLNITVNDVPILIASGGPHSKESQNSFFVKNGINKIEFSFFTESRHFQRTGTAFKLYISNLIGEKPDTFKYPNSFEIQTFADRYNKAQQANWVDFAVNTYKTNCANCHSLDTRAVGPALKGLFGKKQTIFTQDGSKREVIIDEAYIRKAIVNPMAEYPEGYPPAMVLHNKLSETEVETLVKWLIQLK